MRRLITVLAIAGGLLGAQALVGQTSKGILAGSVRDQTGAVVPGASVTVTSEDTGETRTLASSSIGTYRVEAISPGRYEIQVAMTGFATIDVKDIRVQPSVVTSYDPVLSIGKVDQTTTVEANTNGINTDNGELTGVIDTQELATVPVFSLNPFELVATLPGVQLVNPALNLGGTAGNYEQLIVNGARPRSNNFMLDGQDINDVSLGGQSFNPQIPDMYQTTTALLNSSSAEYGRSGGAVVNLVTKSGTNQFHGSVFELYSGSGLDALDGVTREGKPFPVASGNHKGRYDRHQYGFTAGGPLWRNKLFAFGGTQFTRFYGKTAFGQTQLPNQAGYAVLTAIANSPSASATEKAQVALLQGLLNNGSYLTSYSLLQDNVNQSNISAANCPAPGGGNCFIQTANFQRPPAALQSPDTQWMYRIDFIPWSGDTFSFRYLHDRETFTPDIVLNPSSLPGFDGEVGGPAELAQVTWTHVFTQNLLNEFRTSEIRVNDQFTATPETLANPEAKIFNVSLTGSGMPTLGAWSGLPQGRNQQLYQFQDTVGLTVKRHSLRMGVDVGRDHETLLVALNTRGQLSFTIPGGLSSLDNFLMNQLGGSGTATKTFGNTRVDPHLWKIMAFMQDDIRVTPDLSLNLGIRYDYDTNPDNSLQYPAVDPNNPYGPIATVTKVAPDWNNVGPRAGFAFTPHAGLFSDGKTVFHGGIGVFYDVEFTALLESTAVNAPNAVAGNLSSTAPGGLTNATGQLALITPGLTQKSMVASVSSNLVAPITYQYNFGIERGLPFQIQLGVNYVGARGEKLYSNRQLNYVQNGARLNTGRGIINIRDNRGDSNYNSAQVEVTRRFTRGLFLRAAYTFGKDLDDSSEVLSTYASNSFSANLAGDGLGQDYGHSAWDRQHIASFEYMYSPAGFHSSNRAADFLLGAATRGFLISGTTQFSSGPWSSFNYSGIDSNGDGTSGNDRPLVANASLPVSLVGIDGTWVVGTQGVYYDLAAFRQSKTLNPVTPSQVHFLIPGGPTVQQGVGRNSFENPGEQFWNMAAQKSIPAGFRRFEQGKLVLRAECQNIGNHNNVGPLDINLLDVGTSSFMNKSARREPTNRSFRLWAKYVF